MAPQSRTAAATRPAMATFTSHDTISTPLASQKTLDRRKLPVRIKPTHGTDPDSTTASVGARDLLVVHAPPPIDQKGVLNDVS